jgi:hypothetical protein
MGLVEVANLLPMKVTLKDSEGTDISDESLIPAMRIG